MNEFKYLKGDLTYKARTVYVRTDDQGNDYVGLFYQPMYKGVGLSYLTYPMDNNISGDGVVIVAMTSGVDLDVEKPDTVSDCVTQLNVDVESEDMADKVIDFNSALKLVEEKMSGFNRLNVVEVRIEYVLRPIRRITTWADALSVVLYGNLYLALPLITSVASLPIICDELRTNNNYFHFSRIGVKKYIHSKYCSSLIGGVTALLMGFLLFAAIVCVFFPSYYDFGQSQVVGLEEQNIFGMLWQVVKYSLNMICWGALLSIISCGLVSITQNIYIVLCVPFLLNYVAAHVLFNLKIYMFIILAVIFYYMGYKLWIKKYRGVRGTGCDG